MQGNNYGDPDTAKDAAFMESIDSNYLFSIRGQRPVNKQELQTFRQRQREFLQLAIERVIKTLPYQLD